MNWMDLHKQGVRIVHLRKKPTNVVEDNKITQIIGDIIGTIIYKKCSYDEEKIPYGISVVGKKDMPSRKMGRIIAFGRFKKACEGLTKEMKSNPISRRFKIPINEYGIGSVNEIKKIIQIIRG